MKPSSSLSQNRKSRRRSKEVPQTSQTRKSSTAHPLLDKMGVTEIPPALAQMGVTPEALDRLEASDLRDIVLRVRTLSRKLQYEGPSNDDELHAWIKKNMHVDIPREAVCEGHVAPFQFLADLFFERVPSALARANRGGSKTFIVAMLHYLNCTYKAGCGCLSFGATEAQGNRCYGNIEDWCFEHDPESGRRGDQVLPFIRDRPKKSQTVWKTGSTVEVVAGSENAVSGPHPAKAHADEVDQMERPVWNQSRGMAVTNRATGPLPSWMSHYNGMIPPQDIVTSTKNSNKGLMQELLDEIEQDVKAGNIAQFTLYMWCIWETIAEVPNCRAVAKNLRVKRLKQLGMEPDSLCECHRVVKGKMPNGKPRTLETVCAGKAFRSRGWKPYVDLVQTFKRNTPGTWLLQHECQDGQDENSYIQDWSLNLYGVRHYEPHPIYGPIYRGVDWGTTNPAVVLYFQYLTSEVPALGFEYEPIWLQPGVYVLFREIYVAGIGTDTLAKRVVATDLEYKQQFGPNWKVKGTFCDPQGAGDRIIFQNHGIPSSWPIKTRNKMRFIDTVQNLVVDDKFAVSVDECPMFCEEIEAWQKDPRTDKELDKFNHAMSAWRYGISNAEAIEGRRREVLTKMAKAKAQKGAAQPTRRTTVSHRTPMSAETGEIVYGSIASRGGTSVNLDPRFTLNVK